MPRQRPQPPRTTAYANIPLVKDPETRRALSTLTSDTQALQRAGEAVLVDGSRPPLLGGDATGDLWYRGADGKIARLPAGTNGQVLTMVAGVPTWV